MLITDSLSVRSAHKVNDRKKSSTVSLSTIITINYSILALLFLIKANDGLVHKETIESSFFRVILYKLGKNLSLHAE